MRIQHNIAALNAERNKTVAGGELSKSLRKIASGFRINHAADDAAGLAISEKMRAQITGTAQAQSNAENGISLVKTADGAMGEIHAILNRISALADQASNGIYDESDRQSMQQEVDELLEEITRIEKSTTFNGIPLLQGVVDEPDNIAPPPSLPPSPPSVTIKGGMPTWVTMPQLQDGLLTGVHKTQEMYKNADGTTTQYEIEHSAAYLDFSQLTAANISDLLNDNTGFHTTCCTCNAHYSINFTSGTNSDMKVSGQHYIYSIGIDGITNGTDLVNLIVTATNNGNPNGHYTNLAADPNNPAQLIIYDDRALRGSFADPSTPPPSGGHWVGWSNPYPSTAVASPGYGIFGEGVAYENTPTPPTPVPKPEVDPQGIILQIGITPSKRDQLVIDSPDMTLEKIGVKGLSIATQASASAALEKVLTGINYVSTERGRMGAYENRLEYTVNVLSNFHENMTASESRIRDVDIAKEMMKYTKSNILRQSAQAMLAQANQLPQGVMNLLQ